MNQGVLTQAPIANEDQILGKLDSLMAVAEPIEPPQMRFITPEEGARITAVASQFTLPYKFGGKNEADGGVDCSGAVTLIYERTSYHLTERPGGYRAVEFINIPELKAVTVTAKGTPNPKESGEFGGYDLDGAQKGDILMWTGHVAIYDPDCPDKMWSAKGDEKSEGTPFGHGQLSWHAKRRGTPTVLRYQVAQTRITSASEDLLP